MATSFRPRVLATTDDNARNQVPTSSLGPHGSGGHGAELPRAVTA
jgi:hypothetical protein